MEIISLPPTRYSVASSISLLTSHLLRVKLYEVDELYLQADKHNKTAAREMYWFRQGGSEELSKDEHLKNAWHSTKDASTTIACAFYRLRLYQCELDQAQMYFDRLEAIKRVSKVEISKINQFDWLKTERQSCNSLERKLKDLEQRVRGLFLNIFVDCEAKEVY